mmetsp:Transcript_4750/g.9073  ORF Transcript_4750/g.9073 Transcript_4750/m.9073 type:complete len:710 (+) Transcript_4750:134-2263(+)|eukprot:CAMPEP_0176480276 /NCGR_PEP_ID=MMETSP0200_2-20121128/2191_1 /TAXON_ID=947934 /ORGANISM="Chaetoceros sp., Strain GSL56" /LENGTH=709 /DNA_ID=CAMNT_0017876385 /DNA_START=66 /DNA_END=2195 /DNA_ORIENTATION=+
MTTAVSKDVVTTSLDLDASQHHGLAVKSRPGERTLAAPLNTITNEVNWKSRASVTISTSPTFHSVTEAQKKIAELQSRKSKPTLQDRGTKTPGRKYVQEMQKKVNEKITTPSRAPRSAGTINIPMNKVTELKKMLNESKKKEVERLKHAQLNAKKRAEISERVNTVRDLLKGLNGVVHHNGSIIKTSKGEELNLPRDRVSAMKAWLKEFEKNNKEHANMWNTASVSNQGKTRSYVPRTCTRNKSIEFYNRDDDNEETITAVETFDGKTANQLTEWLDEFGEDNNDQYDGSLIEGTSILKKSHDGKQDLNMSMMPATGTSFSGEDILDEESDWEDDYKDLMIRVDIEQINSKESWDKESVISPREFAGSASSDIKDKATNHQVVTMVDNEDEESVSVEEEELFQQDNEQHETSVIGNEPESKFLQDKNLDDSSVESEQEDNVLTFNCYDSMSRISFDGHPVEEKPENENIASTNMSNNDSIQRNGDDLVGEDILEKTDHDVSASFYVNRFADESMIISGAMRNPPSSQKLVHLPRNQKKNRIGMFFSSLNCIKNAKTSKAAAEYTNSYEEGEQIKREGPFLSSNSNNSNSSNYLANRKVDYEANKAEDVDNAYLPALYTMGNRNIPQDYAREMARHGNRKIHGQVPQSPAVSLASEFRRQMSPDSSCISGFTDIEACVMTKNSDIGEHVRHLQGLFQSPVRVPSRRLYQF